ncbi:MAG: carboxypeptidase regulatory-like domain-containing protein [Kofleriaceae bacterium]
MRFLILIGLIACGPNNRNNPGNAEPDATVPDTGNCVGLLCQVVNCEAQGKPPTTISGTVFAPNGTLALYGVTVYIPNLDPGPFVEGAQCERCDNTPLPGEPIVQTISDEAGNFTLANTPAGGSVPLVVTIGKWRRIVSIPMVQQCADNPLPSSLTRLPQHKAEGDIPKIAIATGNCDALECLLRKLGVSDFEFTPESGDGRIHMYASNGANKLADSTPFTNVSALWNDVEKLKQYDIAMLSCECGARPAEKPQVAMDAMKAYADLGGRVFLSHYHNVWITGEAANPAHAPAVWPTIATCTADGFANGDDQIDQVDNPKGASFASWMVNVMGSTTPGVIPIQSGSSRQTCTSIDATKAERWVYMPSGTGQLPQNFQFTTPNELPEEERCGKVVFSDMHVASGSTSRSTNGFPSGCSGAGMTPQEKALAFMFFDIAGCVGDIF